MISTLDNCQRTGWSHEYMGYHNKSFFDSNMSVRVTSDNYTVYFFVVIRVINNKGFRDDYVCIKYGHSMYSCCDKIRKICKLTDIWAD